MFVLHGIDSAGTGLETLGHGRLALAMVPPIFESSVLTGEYVGTVVGHFCHTTSERLTDSHYASSFAGVNWRDTDPMHCQQCDAGADVYEYACHVQIPLSAPSELREIPFSVPASQGWVRRWASIRSRRDTEFRTQKYQWHPRRGRSKDAIDV